MEKDEEEGDEANLIHACCEPVNLINLTMLISENQKGFKLFYQLTRETCICLLLFTCLVRCLNNIFVDVFILELHWLDLTLYL